MRSEKHQDTRKPIKNFEDYMITVEFLKDKFCRNVMSGLK